MKQTAIADAMQRAGGPDANEARFRVELARYLNNGGTVERVYALLMEVAKKLPGEGQGTTAAISQAVSAPSRQPVEGVAGRGNLADSGQSTDARPSSSNRGGGGHIKRADGQKVTATLVREPSQQQITAAASVRKTIAITVLDTMRIRDGRSIGDVRFGELERLSSVNAIEAFVMRQIKNKFANAPDDARVRDLIKPDELNEMRQRAAEMSDAA